MLGGSALSLKPLCPYYRIAISYSSGILAIGSCGKTYSQVLSAVEHFLEESRARSKRAAPLANLQLY